MQIDMLIKGGTVVDGSGADAYAADVRVAGGRIAEIGKDLKAREGERVFDASGCYVTPGMIETHNHWDGGVWWAPNMEPLPAYGATTSINGNCGFSIAPAPKSAEGKQTVVDIFNYFEDIPEEPMNEVVPWDWDKWSEYKASMQAKVRLPLNFCSFCGHVPLRIAVMGMDAWTRAATPAEIATMCMYLDDALTAGAMGLSSNMMDRDKYERRLPPQMADDAEIEALMRVVAKYPGATVQFIVDYFLAGEGNEQVEHWAKLAKKTGVKLQWAGMPALMFMKKYQERALELHEQFKAEGLPIFTAFNVISPTSILNFYSTLIFGQNGNPVWQELINEKSWEKKKAMLTDEAWLDRARGSWDNQFPHSTLNDTEGMLLRESESGFGPVGCTLAEYQRAEGFNHTSDALAKWVLNNGQESVILKRSYPRDDDMLNRLLMDENTLCNVSDSGAHGKMFCGAGYNVALLTEYVRERKFLTIERAIYMLTWRTAEFFGLHDRGLIKQGMVADIAVFNLDEIEMRPEKKIWDVYDGKGSRTYRYTRDAAPMRLTLCNGEPTFDRGEFTGRYPGEFIGPEVEGGAQMAIAAE
jgi:N-acyl-D-amino-acid deacylase